MRQSGFRAARRNILYAKNPWTFPAMQRQSSLIDRASTQMIYAPNRKRSRSIYPRPHRKDKCTVLMLSKQRRQKRQRQRLQQKRRRYILHRLQNIRRASARMICDSIQNRANRVRLRPRRRHKCGKPLWKSRNNAHKIHPSNRSIHPSRSLLRFCHNRLFRMYQRSRRIAGQSRLAAVPPRRNLFHWKPHSQTHPQISYHPSARSQRQTPRRGKNPGAALIFGCEKQ